MAKPPEETISVRPLVQYGAGRRDAGRHSLHSAGFDQCANGHAEGGDELGAAAVYRRAEGCEPGHDLDLTATHGDAGVTRMVVQYSRL